MRFLSVPRRGRTAEWPVSGPWFFSPSFCHVGSGWSFRPPVPSCKPFGFSFHLPLTHRPFDCLHLPPPLHLFFLPPRPSWSFRPARSLVSTFLISTRYPTGHSGPSDTLPASAFLSSTLRHSHFLCYPRPFVCLHFAISFTPSSLFRPCWSFRPTRSWESHFLISIQVSHQSFRLV